MFDPSRVSCETVSVALTDESCCADLPLIAHVILAMHPCYAWRAANRLATATLDQICDFVCTFTVGSRSYPISERRERLVPFYVVDALSSWEKSQNISGCLTGKKLLYLVPSFTLRVFIRSALASLKVLSVGFLRSSIVMSSYTLCGESSVNFRCFG